MAAILRWTAEESLSASVSQQESGPNTAGLVMSEGGMIRMMIEVCVREGQNGTCAKIVGYSLKAVCDV